MSACITFSDVGLLEILYLVCIFARNIGLYAGFAGFLSGVQKTDQFLFDLVIVGEACCEWISLWLIPVPWR